MIDFAAMFGSMQVMGNLAAAKSSGSPDTGKSGKDAFSAVLSRAADRTAAETGIGAATGTVTTEAAVTEAEAADTAAVTPSEEDNPLGDISQEDAPDIEEQLIDDDSDIGDAELSLLAGLTIIHNNPVISPADPETPVGETQPVISILEGNMDIDAQAQIPAAVEGAVEQELTARMPQETQQVQQPTEQAEEESDIAVPRTEDDSSCPLENKNDATGDTGIKTQSSEGRSAEDSDSDDSRDSDDSSKTRIFEAQQTVDISPERLSSTEKLTSTQTAPATATTETLMETMVEKIEMSAFNESTHMEIQLKPDFLGKVTIQLQLGDAGLEIKIKSDDMDVKNLILSQISQLSDSLSDKGVKVNDIDVIYSEVSEHSSSQSQSQDSQQQGKAYINNYTGDETVDFAFGLGFTDDADTVSVIDTGISSVEYRA